MAPSRSKPTRTKEQRLSEDAERETTEHEGSKIQLLAPEEMRSQRAPKLIPKRQRPQRQTQAAPENSDNPAAGSTAAGSIVPQPPETSQQSPPQLKRTPIWLTSSQSARRDPYQILARAREKHGSLQRTDLSIVGPDALVKPDFTRIKQQLPQKLSNLKETIQQQPGQIKQSVEATFKGTVEQSRKQISNSVKATKDSVERRFSFGKKLPSTLQSSPIISIKAYFYRSKTKLKSGIQKLLQRVETTAHKAAEELN